ncbi:unnamed protein product, partial [Polarella glacialis]
MSLRPSGSAPELRRGRPSSAEPISFTAAGGESEASRPVSASPPSRQSLAFDIRRLARADTQESPLNVGNSSSMSTGSAREPLSGSRKIIGGMQALGNQQQYRELSNLISQLQGQRDADRRRLVQMERRIEAQLEERLHVGDGRERWAETQGNVNGLLEDMQAMRLRIDGVEPRLLAKLSESSGEAKQRLGELGQQVQALEQKNRLAAATIEETQRRQVGKLRRSEQSLEELLQRMSAAEEELRSRPARNGRSGQGFDPSLEGRMRGLEQHQEYFDASVRALQLQVEQAVQSAAEAAEDAVRSAESVTGNRGAGLSDIDDEARLASERGLVALEKRLSGQVQDLSSAMASLRVKVDGQLQRLSSVAERLET